jgi:hypothetical protein
MAAARMTQAASMVPMPMGRGRRGGGRRGMAIGGRVGYASGSDGPLVPVHLAAGEGVLSPEVASQFSDMQLQRLNNADKNGYGANPDMLDGHLWVLFQVKAVVKLIILRLIYQLIHM